MMQQVTDPSAYSKNKMERFVAIYEYIAMF